MKPTPPGIHEATFEADPQAAGHLVALGKLLDLGASDASELFDHCLGLLVDRLKVDRAVVTKKTELGLETFWWAHGGDMPVADLLAQPGSDFGARMMTLTRRTLAIRDAAADARWKDDPGYTRHGIRAYLGAPLLQGGEPIGTLSIEHRDARAFTRGEVGLVLSIANIISRTLEIEQLKHELRLTRDALELTSAVVEDSALQTGSGLPNQRYLEIWLKANLFLAKRRGDLMAVVIWRMSLSGSARKRLTEVAAALRGEDLLVDLGREEFLMLLPRTPVEGTNILLGRMREQLGEIPMGATMWDPEADDVHIRKALARCEKARFASQGEVRWVLLGEPGPSVG